MLICNCPDEVECPAIGSDVVCFPWCEYLEDGDGDAAEAAENGRTMIKDSGERTKFPSGALPGYAHGQGADGFAPLVGYHGSVEALRGGCFEIRGA